MGLLPFCEQDVRGQEYRVRNYVSDLKTDRQGIICRAIASKQGASSSVSGFTESLCMPLQVRANGAAPAL